MSDIEQCINEAGKGPFGFGLGAPRAKASLISMLLLLVPLAGCAGSDGEVNVDLTTEEIQELIDDNIDDFLNNSSVTVVNNYHNNTTIDQSGDSTSSTTNNYNGSSSEPELHVLSVTWDREATIIGYDPATAQLTRPIYRDQGSDGNYSNEVEYGIGIGPISNYGDDVIYVTSYDGITVEITATCSEAAIFRNWNDDHWANWVQDNYGNDGEYYHFAQEIRGYFDGMYYWDTVRDLCGWSDTYTNSTHTLFEISLGEGEAIEFIQLDLFLHLKLECDDGFSADYGFGGNSSGSTSNVDSSLLMGGQANCTVYGSTYHSAWWYMNSESEVRFQLIPAASFNVYYRIMPVFVD